MWEPGDPLYRRGMSGGSMVSIRHDLDDEDPWEGMADAAHWPDPHPADDLDAMGVLR